MKAVAIIPARYESSRFPGKPLVMLRGKSMIQRVCAQVSKCSAVQSYWVATDDQRIFDHCSNAQLPVIMTSAHHSSGTERVAEAVLDIDADVVVNVQGDEPFVNPEHLRELLALFETPEQEIVTLKSKLRDSLLLSNENVVKVVTDLAGRALYFSRSPIPAVREKDAVVHYRHHGVYAFRKEVLLKIVTDSVTPLEQAERLEQLRWMENGYAIQVAEVDDLSLSIDTPDDLDRALRWMEQEKWS